jgi:hypothetical protein
LNIYRSFVVNEPSAQPLAYFTIESPIEDVFSQLFSTSGTDGTLNFGFTASSIGPSDRAQLESGSDFRDYILEGFVKYRLKLAPATFGCVLGVGSFGDNRIDAIIAAIKHYLKSAEIEAIQMAMADPPPTSL